jgi:hypothetical protein
LKLRGEGRRRVKRRVAPSRSARGEGGVQRGIGGGQDGEEEGGGGKEDIWWESRRPGGVCA